MAKVYKNPGPIKFKAVIKSMQTRNNPASFIEFPYDLKETFGVGNLVPYTVVFDGRVNYRGSLAKMGGPKAMILLRSDVEAELGKSPGESVEVVVELDDKPREVEVLPELKAALVGAGLWAGFEKLAFTHRKEFAQWVAEAKKPETRDNRIAKAIEMVRAKIK